MKKIVIFLSTLLVSVSALSQPKYVFFFIGDGMGINDILLTEMYNAAIKGEHGTEPLVMSQFPVATMSSTYSNSSLVTDSAASGTALATGSKTANLRICMNTEGTEPLTTMAEMAKRTGKKVGVMSTVNVNHATPAAFEAHQNNRSYYYEISRDMIANGFDFYAGAGLYNEANTFDGKDAAPIRPQFEAAGYTICNLEGFNKGWKDAEKVLMLPAEGEQVTFRIDVEADKAENRPNYITLKDMVESAVTFLMKDNKKGFFIMAEGGLIDHAAHSRDAATTIREINDFDEAIAVAFDFYKKYPKQTLIVVTSDHDTGGLIIRAESEQQLARLQYQKFSLNMLSNKIKQSMQNEQRALTWEETKAFLEENLGLWKQVPMNADDEKMLHDIYDSTIACREAGSVKDLYSDNAKLMAAAVTLLNKKCGAYWQTNSHTAGFVPVFAIGKGSEHFTHKTDNAQIGREIISTAAYK